MYDPSAVAVAVDSTLVIGAGMHVDVETRASSRGGDRGESVMGRLSGMWLHGDRYVIEGLDKVAADAKVCVDVDAERLLRYVCI